MPMASDGRSDWTFVESMNFSVCGLRGGALECWGSNNYNQLGRGAGSDENSDEILPAMGPAAWSRVSTGIWHTVGIDDTGALYCWGSAVHSTCAMAGIEELDVPTRIGTESTWDEVCGGFYQTCGIRDGTLLCWGWNRDGETGTGGKGGAISSMTRVDDASDWAEVTCGFGHTCARREDGRVFCFGCDGTECYSGAETECGGDCTGKLGTGVPASSGIPLEISGGLLARSIDAGTHTCAVGMDSSLWCWGPNPSGVLGVGDVLMRDVPTELPLRGWIDVSAGRRHTCAIREGGQLYCWGSNEDRQLGDEASLDGELSPARVCIR
jgi:alpha-tubulin suppressor-like RCC1 family protein